MDPGVSGHITANTTWTGTVKVSGAVTVDPGITLTIAPGTTVNFAGNAGLTAAGIVDASGGTKAAPITLHGDGTPHFDGVTIPMGGQVTYSYVTQDGGGVYMSGTAKLTATDSVLANSSGDYLVMDGGTVNVMYSTLGVMTGTTTTHCNMHFNAGTAANVVTLSHSNVGGAPYGIMFYGGNAANFTYDNWVGNSIDVDSQAGSPTSADFSNSYFPKGAPVAGTGSTFTLTGISTTTMVVDAGPR